MAAAPHPQHVGLREWPRQPPELHQLRAVPVTAVERFGAAYLTFGLSLRLEQLAELDRLDDEAHPATS